jgi:hypothetical protein
MAKKVNRVQLSGHHAHYYSLADSCKVLGKSRSTLMRLLPAFERVTKGKPVKDHSGRWFLPAKTVHNLRDSPKLYLKLAGRATKWEDKVSSLKRENKELKTEVKALRRIIKHGDV